MIDLISSALAHRPPIEHTLMESAKLWARRSTCSRNEVGVVIAHADNRILVTGYNGAPSGLPHCRHVCTCSYEQERDDAIVKGVMFTRARDHEDGCHALRPCKTAVHAEANAIAFAARNGIRTDQTTLYTTLAPCYACSQLIINAGIVRVVYLTDYRIAEGLELLGDAGVDVIRYNYGDRPRATEG